MKIGDRVRYDEENVALDDIEGTIVEPTEQERAETDVVFRPRSADVMVAWDDGERYWEAPESLVVIERRHDLDDVLREADIDPDELGDEPS